LEPEENEKVIAAVLSESKDSRLVSVRPRIQEIREEGILSALGAERLLRCVTAEGCLRLLPGMFESDGFFVAMIEKNV
jgi:16S rRNA C967 or C1407 C5-methylase (RsmB/RsmF family)